MMLKDAQGRTVLIRDNRVSSGPFTFWAREGLTMVPVDEAIICKGKDLFLSEEQIAAILKEKGFEGLPFKIEFKSYAPLQVERSAEWADRSWSYMMSANRKQDYTINGLRVQEEEYDRLGQVLIECNSYDFLLNRGIGINKGTSLKVLTVLEMIGEGKVVTPESLEGGYAKGEDRPRLMVGDSVRVKSKGKEILGVVKAMSSKVTVLRQDGNKSSCAYDSLERTEESGHSSELASQVDHTIWESFEYTLQSSVKRIFKTKLEKADFVFPAFPDKDQYGRQETQHKSEGVQTCTCPVCGWRMANINNSDEFQCCYCRIRGVVINQTAEEVSLLMMRMPGKNSFNIKEARCCNNCGLFSFEYGRQGKRSTGYCRQANRCLQSHNVCDLWYPRDPSTYESNMKQHITNLHFGVKDGRNTSRNDIKDTVYTEDDHKAEMIRADRAKVAYANAFRKFQMDLKELAGKKELVAEMTPELTAEWIEVLDDPC